MEDCSIGENCRINNVDLGKSVKIDNNVFIADCRIDRNVRIYRDCDLFETEIARYSYIAQRSVISHTKIGAFCSLGRNIHCTGANHPIEYLSTSPIFYSSRKQCGTSFSDKDKFNEFLEIDIGNDVWIGSNAIILGGVKISNGAIIGAGSVVTKNVDPYSIVAGNPAKHIRYRFDENIIKKIIELAWWEWDDELILKNLEKFQATFSDRT